MECADRGLINGSRLNTAPKALSGFTRSSAPLYDHLLFLHLTPVHLGFVAILS